jgi:hypothetical protein
MASFLTPELIQLLTYAAIGIAGYFVRHYDLLSVATPAPAGGAPSLPIPLPSGPPLAGVPQGHPVLDRILQILNQAADDALTQAASQIVSQPTAKPAATTQQAH